MLFPCTDGRSCLEVDKRAQFLAFSIGHMKRQLLLSTAATEKLFHILVGLLQLINGEVWKSVTNLTLGSDLEAKRSYAQ